MLLYQENKPSGGCGKLRISEPSMPLTASAAELALLLGEYPISTSLLSFNPLKTVSQYF